MTALGLQTESYMGRPRSVIGEVQTTRSGNIVLRVGREDHPDGVGWHQTEHVVLEPDEAAKLRSQLPAPAPRTIDVEVMIEGMAESIAIDDVEAALRDAGISVEAAKAIALRFVVASVLSPASPFAMLTAAFTSGLEIGARAARIADRPA